MEPMLDSQVERILVVTAHPDDLAERLHNGPLKELQFLIASVLMVIKVALMHRSRAKK
jgi:hypothetical protein